MDVAVVGGGQAALAVGFYLRRAGLVPGSDFVLLDAAAAPGGAWSHMWDGLRLFSPAAHSSLPGWMMPPWDDAAHGFPTRDHVVAYLSAYEQRYELDVQRPRRVTRVASPEADPGRRLSVHAEGLTLAARVVVSATGTWSRPFWPRYRGADQFAGRQLHAAHYRRPDDFAGQRVVVVGGGNSAAQILAEVAGVAETTWVTLRPPRFLPDDVDGRALFAAATERVRALRAGSFHHGVGGLGDIVMVPSVRAARDRGVLHTLPMFERLTPTGVAWSDGTTRAADAVVWCTGFRPALSHLRSLGLTGHGGRLRLGGPAGTQAADDLRLHLVGYGDWTGPASATLIGVGRTARDTSAVIVDQLRSGTRNNG